MGKNYHLYSSANTSISLVAHNIILYYLSHMIISDCWLWINIVAFWDDNKGEVILCNSVDISIAVATEKVSISFTGKISDC